MIRCVMFDFGNVLVHFDTQRWYDFIKAHWRFGTPDQVSVFRAECIIKYDLGLIDDFEFFETTKRTLGLNVGIDEFFFEWADNMKPDLRMVVLKQALKQNGIKLAVVSNINRYHFEYARQRWPEVFMNFDHLALSFRMGIRKPDLKMWQLPVRKLRMKSEECFFIDDQEPNIAAFEKFGGVGHHYNVVDDAFCPNGQLETERAGLVNRMVKLGILNNSQAKNILKTP